MNRFAYSLIAFVFTGLVWPALVQAQPKDIFHMAKVLAYVHDSLPWRHFKPGPSDTADWNKIKRVLNEETRFTSPDSTINLGSIYSIIENANSKYNLDLCADLMSAKTSDRVAPAVKTLELGEADVVEIEITIENLRLIFPMNLSNLVEIKNEGSIHNTISQEQENEIRSILDGKIKSIYKEGVGCASLVKDMLPIVRKHIIPSKNYEILKSSFISGIEFEKLRVNGIRSSSHEWTAYSSLSIAYEIPAGKTDSSIASTIVISKEKLLDLIKSQVEEIIRKREENAIEAYTIEYTTYLLGEYLTEQVPGVSSSKLLSLINKIDGGFSSSAIATGMDPTPAQVQVNLQLHGEGLGYRGGGLGLPSQAVMLDGLALFVAERLKDEVALAFLRELETHAKVNLYVRTLFPSLSKYVTSLNVIDWGHLGKGFKAILAEDLQNLHVNSLVLFKKLDSLGVSKPDGRKFVALRMMAEVLSSAMTGDSPHEIWRQLAKHDSLRNNTTDAGKLLFELATGIDYFTYVDPYTGIPAFYPYEEYAKMSILEQEFAVALLYHSAPQLYGIAFKACGDDGGLIDRMKRLLFAFSKPGMQLAAIVKTQSSPTNISNRVRYQSYLNAFMETFSAVKQAVYCQSSQDVRLEAFFVYAQKALNLYTALDQQNYSAFAQGIVAIVKEFVDNSSVSFNPRATQLYFTVQSSSHGCALHFANSPQITVADNDKSYFKGYNSLRKEIEGFWKKVAALKDMHQNSDGKIDDLLKHVDKIRVDLDNIKLEIDKLMVKHNADTSLSKNHRFAIERLNSLLRHEQAWMKIVQRAQANQDPSLSPQSLIEAMMLEGLALSIRSRDEMLQSLMKYAAFLAEVMEAQNGKQMQEIVRANALPVGSFSMKRSSLFTLTLSAYPGVLAGSEMTLDDGTYQSGGLAGVTCPVGLAFDWGVRREKIRRTWYAPYSLGFAVTAIDIGALVQYRLGDSNTETSPNVEFASVLSPGVLFNYGIGKRWPITVGVGSAFSPALRKVSASNVDAGAGTLNALRFFGYVAFDLPLFKLANQRNRSFGTIRSLKYALD